MSIKPASKAFSAEGRIKRRLRAHLSDLGFQRAENGALVLPDTGKDTVRTLHRQQRLEVLSQNAGFIESHMRSLLGNFASGDEIAVEKIKPVLQRVSAGTWEANLFRLASLTWSVPVSAGFGRRIRYLVWDEFHGKLIGIVAIGDPVYNLAVRDNLIGWSVADRAERLVCVMDAYVLGAVPPYNALLGGKLVASLLRTRDVYNDFASAYGGTTGIISGKDKKARCLRSFKNKIEHHLLDRHVGSELVEYLLSGKIPEFNAERVAASAHLLMTDLQRQYSDGIQFEREVTVTLASGDEVSIPILCRTANGRALAIFISAPLTEDTVDEGATANRVADDLGMSVVSVNELLVRENLPAATTEVQSEIKRL